MIHIKTLKTLLISLMIVISLVVFSGVLFNNEIKGAMVKPDKAYITITVEANDTLWDIAAEYMNRDYYTHHTFIDEVVEINHVSANRIYAGTTLVIPIIKE